MEKIQNKQDKLLEDTGAWMLSDSTFTKWLNDDTAHLLWLRGDPGKGKTMLAISLVTDLSDRIRLQGSASSTALAYFFCDNKDSRRKTCTTLLRGLIYQLICQRPELCVYLRDQYEKQKEQLFSSPNAAQSLWRILQDIIRHASLQNVIIVIDALDECEAESIETLLTLLDPDSDSEPKKPFHNDLSTPNRNASEKVKWLITSRNEVFIKQMLAGSLEISLETNHTHVDAAVRKFVNVKSGQLQRRKGYDTDLRIHVENHLREKAEGTFLWVALACRELSKPTVLSMITTKVLSRLPSGITPLYERIMDQIINFEDEELVEYAKSILRSMVVALRPLTLSELAIAANLPEEHRHNVPALSEYVNQCSSIVTVREHTVYFVHLSAKTYILSMDSMRIVSPDLKAEHEFIALNCFNYVRRCLAKDHSRTAYLHEAETQETEAEYPMLFWTDHTRHAPMAIAKRFDLQDEFFQPRSTLRQAWFDLYWTKMHAKWEVRPSEITALHLAAYAGLPCLVGTLLDLSQNSEFLMVDSLGNTPLLWAAKYGYETCVRLLLKAGADNRTENYEGMTALQWAAGNGHSEIVKLLFDGKKSIQTRDKNDWTPLHRAAYNGHVSVVRLLLDLGADIEELDGSTWTALHRSASSGQPDVVKLLLERGASIHALDREQMTPMLHAAWAGHAQIIKMHIDEKADVNTQDLNGWTALHSVAWNGHSNAARLLLKLMADVHIKNSDGSSPLHHAAWSGQTDVANLLIAAGADVNAEDEEGETPLQQAAWRGHVSIAEVLLASDVDIDKKNSIGHTALHQAASSGQEEITTLLLAKGADPTALDKHGQSPRALAEANEHDVTAGLLKAREAELSAFSESTTTPVDLPTVDIAVAEALSIDPMLSTVQPHQAAGFFVPEKITTMMDGKPKFFYIKSGSNKEMFESESEKMLQFCRS